MMCVGILAKIPMGYFDEKLDQYKNEILGGDESKFALYFEKYVMRGLVNCIAIAKNAEQIKLI